MATEKIVKLFIQQFSFNHLIKDVFVCIETHNAFHILFLLLLNIKIKSNVFIHTREIFYGHNYGKSLFMVVKIINILFFIIFILYTKKRS